MSTHLIQSPFVARQTVRPTTAQPGFWQRMRVVLDEIGRERAQRQLGMLAQQWDQTGSRELARQARQTAAAIV